MTIPCSLRSDYRNYLLTTLTVILAFNYVDRLAFGLMIQAIKGDLHLSDTELGFMSGIGFAFFYGVMGIPIARWADRGNRVTILSLAAATWSVAVVLCGLAMSLVQLLMARMVAAIGEAGCIPPAHSLIGEYFSRAERPRAVARYMLGIPLAVVIGYFGGGWMIEFWGWRVAFVLLGVPGLALAGLAWLTLKESRRNGAPGSSPNKQTHPNTPAQLPLGAVWANLRGNRTFRHLLIGNSVAWFFGMGIQQWQAAFFIRSFGLKTGELGTWFALIGGLAGSLGTFLGGELALRYAKHNERLQLKAVAISSCGYAVLSMLAFSSSTPYWAFGLMAAAAVIYTASWGPLFAVIQMVVAERMRATAVALVYLFANLIGFGLGPLLAGALSDLLRPALHEESLRYVLLALWPGYFIASVYIWQANRTVAHDLQSALRQDSAFPQEEAPRHEDALATNVSSRSFP